MTHTPGPWTAEPNGGDDPDKRPVFITSKFAGASETVAEAYTSITDDDEMVIANARLIATAPELLEALRNITECAEAGADGANMDLWIEQARAAIAKAEGK